MLSAPLRLTAMTLRGLGPYLHGARLEIKPLTILCGENGSGKSTWIEMLQAFKEAAKSEQFPIVYLPDSVRTGINRVLLNGGERGYHGMMGLSTDELKSARIELCQTTFEDEITESEFGKPGVLGFEIEIASDLRIPGIDHDGCDLPNVPTSVPEKMLWLGELPSGAKMRLRWSSLKTGWRMEGLHSWVELELGDGAMLRLRRSFEGGSHDNGLVSEDVWIFECSSDFFPDLLPSETDAILLGTFCEPRNSYETSPNALSEQLEAVPDSSVAAPLVKQACANFLVLFREVCRETLRGFFPIGALRHILAQESTQAAPIDVKLPDDYDPEAHAKADFEAEFGDLPNWQAEWERVREEWVASDINEMVDQYEGEYREDVESIQRQLGLNDRHVGCDGSMTQEQHAHWAYNLMRQPIAPRCGAIDNSFDSEEFPKGVGRSIEGLPPDFLAHVLSIASDHVREAWLQSEGDDVRRNELGIQLLNSVITSRKLFAREFRPNAANINDELAEMLGATAEEQDDRLWSKKTLSDDEVIRVNRLMLETLFNEFGEERCLHRTGYLFETFVSFWLKRFTQTPVKYGDFDGASLDESWRMCGETLDRLSPPLGGLTDATRRGRSRGIHADRSLAYNTFVRTEEDAGDRFSTEGPFDLYAIIFPPTASGSTPWHAMSTGFHQLAPIVVQAGLLRQHEIMAVENPEVHLHPSLQIEVAEFLIHQALAGKNIIVETHSDLFVRRILRAIREEDIKQEAIRIYFTHLENGLDDANWKHAVMESLKINDQGQIANWPKGFMDDDLEEANRWLAALERQRSLDDEE